MSLRLAVVGDASDMLGLDYLVMFPEVLSLFLFLLPNCLPLIQWYCFLDGRWAVTDSFQIPLVLR